MNPGDMPRDFLDIHLSVYLARAQTKPTYLAKVKHEVQAMMSMIGECRPYYVRCLRSAKTISTSVSVLHGRYAAEPPPNSTASPRYTFSNKLTSVSSYGLTAQAAYLKYAA